MADNCLAYQWAGYGLTYRDLIDVLEAVATGLIA